MDIATLFLGVDSFTHLFAITSTFLVAGWVKGVVGLGLPTVAMGLLGLVMPPMEAASLLIIPSAVTNLWQLAAGPNFLRLIRRLRLMLIGIVVGTLAGHAMLPRDLTGYAAAALGIALMLYAVIGLSALRVIVPPRWEAWLAPAIGAATGLVTSVTGVFVIPAVPYLQGLGLDKEDLVQALGLAFTVSTFSLAASLAIDGAFRPAVAITSLYALMPSFAGMLAGQWIRSRIRAEVFRRIFFLGLLALGAHLSLHTLMP